ncbi:MAG: restriction endonuclease-like protein [Paludibacteraceae bacterium]|nr:restriction endonuclease-like protein [Paludibacteraceae bacterium]
MQTEVLRFTHPDYEVIVRTQDIGYSWERFKGRINYSRKGNNEIEQPEAYCRYASKEECKLCLYSPITGKKTDDEEETRLEAGKVWDKLWPVIFETCKYQVRLLFHGVDKDSVPEIRHVRKDIEDSFFVDEELNGREEKSLTGELDFLNEPGVFKLEFSYQKNGIHKNSYVTFEVVSPKLDTKNDYKSLLREVNEEYENVIYRYLSITLQQFGRGRINTESTWMAAFQSIVDDYLKNLKRVIQNPHSQIVNHRTSGKAEQIKFWTPAMEERYAEIEKEGKLENYHFVFDEARSTYDTKENRFVKYTLQSIGHKLSTIISTILNSNQEELSERHREMWIGYLETTKRLLKHPFFKKMGKYEGIKQESLVLQNRTGYQQIYKDWLKLKRGIDLYNGAANIGTLQIWEIYELWCFIKMKKLVADAMGIDYNNPQHEQLITEPKGTLLNPFTNSSLEHIVEYRYPEAEDDDTEERKTQLAAHKGDIVTLHYQHTFNRRSGKGDYGMGINTATTEQRPDIVLNIRKASGEVVLTYLYDAKYRVINDKKFDSDLEEQDDAEMEDLPGGDYPPTDAINQMHRYRDAIYYSKEHEPYRSKEIIGGYILFPGRGSDEHIKKRYYSASVESVNIGAFPLLPNSDKLLKEHLDDILMNYTSADTHVAKAKPQRTLAYVTEEEKAGMLPDDLVMIAIAGSEEKRQWTFNYLWYNIPLEKIADSPWNQAKYLLLYVKGEKFVGNLCKIVRTKHDVWTKDKLKESGYPEEPSHTAYFMIRIHRPKETETELREKYFNVKNITDIYWGNHKMAFMLVKLRHLTI